MPFYNSLRSLLTGSLLLLTAGLSAQVPAADVNIFLGTSGDYGQLSPAASAPFSYLSIGPQTDPHIHAGYEHLAKKFKGFTHNRFEGVGCKGSGGILFVKPFTGADPHNFELLKTGDTGSAGYYAVNFSNGIRAAMSVAGYEGLEQYSFPEGTAEKKLFIDFGYAFNGAFIEESHTVAGNRINGQIRARTTCGAGAYTVYFVMEFGGRTSFSPGSSAHELIASQPGAGVLEVRTAFSSNSIAEAAGRLGSRPLEMVRKAAAAAWSDELSRITVKGDPAREKLFYSMLYRSLQSPYVVSGKNGSYRAIDGSIQRSEQDVYHGWSIWDNYKTQLPLLSLAFSNRYQAIAQSVANLYRYGKKDYATQTEPANSVRTEHAMVVLLDALNKGYRLNLDGLADSLIAEAKRIDTKTPDKRLEAAIDYWALGGIFKHMKRDQDAERYRQMAASMWRTTWNQDFKDLTKNDVDRLPARNMYQGTVWQYRWLVPYDLKGLISAAGGAQEFISQLDTFFGKNYYTHTNEPDIQAPVFYNAAGQPWKSQKLMRSIALDTITENYFNSNERDIGAYIGRVFKNQPEALLRTMDDDGGAMSSWFVLAAVGMYPAVVGHDVYYLNVPAFPSVRLRLQGNKSLYIVVKNYSDSNPYIQRVVLNGKDLKRTWLTHAEIMQGGTLEITANPKPQPYGSENLWVSAGN
ncbi:glycoside hydrolase domain-containing protein [Pedobacter sp. SYP-B3415]|uniref:glycoside hydrolase domain-containing protein n=1 Tax=Pedobacter sp. SYP-B3415 TaxID=2496641 RepID=UPI00101DB55D|nr:glycoside hydrolase domain-containing protein [Pedobacter sp. SYP-B3415]